MKVEVLVACDIDGTARAIGDVVDTTEETATALISEGKVKAVVEAPAPAAEAPAAAPSGDAALNAPPQEAARESARVLVQADLDANPLLVELSAAVGDTVAVTKAVG